MLAIGNISVTRMQLAAAISCNTKEETIKNSLTYFQKIKDLLSHKSNQANIEKLWHELREPDTASIPAESEGIPNNSGEVPEAEQHLFSIISKLREACTDKDQLQFLDKNLQFIEYQDGYALKFDDLIVPSITYAKEQIPSFMIPSNNNLGIMTYRLPSTNTTHANLYDHGNDEKTFSDPFIKYLADGLNSQSRHFQNYTQTVLPSWYEPLTSEQKGRFIGGLLQHCEPETVFNALLVAYARNDIKASVVHQLIQDKNPTMFTVFRTLYEEDLNPKKYDVDNHQHKQQRDDNKPSAYQLVSQMIAGAHMYQKLASQKHEKTLEYQCYFISLLLVASCFHGTPYQDEQGFIKTVCAESLAGEAWDTYHRIKIASFIDKTSNTHWKNLADIMTFDAELTLNRLNAYMGGKPRKAFALHSLPEYSSKKTQHKVTSDADDPENQYAAQCMYITDKSGALERDKRCGTEEQFVTFEGFSDSQKQVFHLLRNANELSLTMTQHAQQSSQLMQSIQQFRKTLLDGNRRSMFYRTQVAEWAESKGFEEHGLCLKEGKLSQAQRQAAIELFLKMGLEKEAPVISDDKA